jgi:hypothetical protein
MAAAAAMEMRRMGRGVMEKVRVDTEIRKLHQLRAAHLNRQHTSAGSCVIYPGTSPMLEKPSSILTSTSPHATRMTAKNSLCLWEGSVFGETRARGGSQPTGHQRVLSHRDDYTLRRRAALKGFAILSKGQRAARAPELFIRGAGTYTAHLNADSPTGTMQSIESTPRGLDQLAEKEGLELRRLEKTLTDYQAQDGKPFEHQARLKGLRARQARINAALDLDKSDVQAAESVPEPDLETAAVPDRTANSAACPARSGMC